jgi:hypothetical protein
VQEQPQINAYVLCMSLMGLVPVLCILMSHVSFSNCILVYIVRAPIHIHGKVSNSKAVVDDSDVRTYRMRFRLVCRQLPHENCVRTQPL